MKVITKITSLFLVIAMIACALISCSEDVSLESTEEDLRTVMTIEGFDVPYEQFRYFFMNYKTQIESGESDVWTKEGGDALRADLDASVVGALRGVYAVLDLCRDYGININDDSIQLAVEATIAETIESYDGKNNGHKKYAAGLAENYMTDSVYRFLVGVDLCETELYNTFLDLSVIDGSDEAALANINGDDFIRTVQILIKNDAGDDVEENRKTAEDLLARIKNGEDFDTLVGRYSEDLSMTPDGYYSTHLELIEEYEEEAYKLEIGEVSEVVESYLGFHIIKRLPKESEYIEKNFDNLKTQYLASSFYSILEEEKGKLDVQKNSLYESFTVENMK